MINTDQKNIILQFKSQNGLTITGLLFGIVSLILIILIVFWVLGIGKKGAYEISARHDLLKFIDAQETYYSKHLHYYGNANDIINNDPKTPSTINLADFTLSDGVIIKIISSNPFIVKCSHNRSNTIFKYNFQIGVLEKIQGAK